MLFSVAAWYSLTGRVFEKFVSTRRTWSFDSFSHSIRFSVTRLLVFIGVLPGLGPIAAIALLLPLTFTNGSRRSDHHAGGNLLWRDVRRLHHVHSGQHSGRGGFWVTRLDGYQMARQGRAGPALYIRAGSSSPGKPSDSWG